MTREPATDTMHISAIAPWFGSKRNLAPRIVAALGPHRCYWDVFCGSLAVPLAKPAAKFETVNDLHGDLINLARVLQSEDHAVDLYGRLSRTLMHEDFFHEACERFKARDHAPAGESPDTDRATDFMIASWVGRNGVAGTDSYNQGFCVRYTGNGGHGATRWRSATDSIPAWHHRLRNMTILNRCAFCDLLPRIEDAEGTAIYLDPPYITKGAEYVHDFGTPGACGQTHTHEELAALLARFRQARIVLSYYDHPLLEKLYPKWSRRCIEVSKAMAHQGRRGQNDTSAVEVLLCNQHDAASLFAPEAQS